MSKTTKKLASEGQGGDNMIAHLTGGEMIIPPEVLNANPELAQLVAGAFHKVGADPTSFIAGSKSQSINPKTGIPQFSFFSHLRDIVEKGLGMAAGFAVGGPAGAAIGAGLVGGVQGDRGLSLIGDAASGYLGGGTAFNLGSGIVNSADQALGGVGGFGTGSTIGSLASDAGSAISSAGTSIKNGLSNVGNFLTGGGSTAAADAGTAAAGAGSAGLSSLPSFASDLFPGGANNALNIGDSLSSAGTAGLGGGTAATGGYGAAVLSKLNSAPSWLAPVASLASGGLQYEGTQDAIKAEQEAQAKQQAIEQPFVDAGTGALSQETNLVENPQAQADYIKNNPLYTSLATDATNRLLATQASTGKVGSGGTANALQQQLLELGTGLVNNQVSNLQNITATGANAASGVGSGIINTGNNTAQLSQDAGTNVASGVTGAANGVTSNYNNQISTLLALQRLQNPNVQTYTPQQISI